MPSRLNNSLPKERPKTREEACRMLAEWHLHKPEYQHFYHPHYKSQMMIANYGNKEGSGEVDVIASWKKAAVAFDRYLGGSGDIDESLYERTRPPGLTIVWEGIKDLPIGAGLWPPAYSQMNAPRDFLRSTWDMTIPWQLRRQNGVCSAISAPIGPEDLSREKGRGGR